MTRALPSKRWAPLRATCWCERRVGIVTAEEVAAGQTWSCGPGCTPPCDTGGMTEPRTCCCRVIITRQGQPIRQLDARCPIHHREHEPETRDA